MNFTPITKNLAEIYGMPELDENRFQFLMSLLEDSEVETQSLKFFLPYLFARLITDGNVHVLLEKYLVRANLLRQGRWVVGEKEIAFLRVVVRAFNIYLLREEKSLG